MFLFAFKTGRFEIGDKVLNYICRNDNVDFSRIKRIQKDFSFFQGDLVDVDFFLLYYLKRGI